MARRSFRRAKRVPGKGKLSAAKQHLPDTDEGQALADLIDKSCALLSKITNSNEEEKVSGNQQSRTGVPVSTGLRLMHVESFLTELIVAAGEAGIYGVLFKILALIKKRADKVKEVDDKAELMNGLAEHILGCFYRMKPRYAGSSSPDKQKSIFTELEEEAVLLFAECARVLGSIISKTSGHRNWIDKVTRPFKRWLTSAGNLQALDICVSKLGTFALKIILEHQARTVNNDPPYRGQNGWVGNSFGQSINELKQFISAGGDPGQISVVHITGVQGAGKSRLGQEIVHALYSEQTRELTIELLQIDCSKTSGSHLEPVDCQRKLLEQIADGRAAEGLSLKEAGYTKIQNALRAWKESSIGPRRKVVMFFDNAPTNTSVLSDILPDDISKLLPPGSCVLLSMRGNDSDWKSSGVYGRIQRLFPSPTCRHRVHEVKGLERVDATKLFQQCARGPPNSDLDAYMGCAIIHDLIEGCKGNPKLLVLFGNFFGSQPRTYTPSFCKHMVKRLKNMDGSTFEFSDEFLDWLWKQHTSQAAKPWRKFARFIKSCFRCFRTHDQVGCSKLEDPERTPPVAGDAEIANQHWDGSTCT